jgi:hypothetical protein
LVWGVAVAMLMTAGPAQAQATSTFNGRVLDQADAALPGVVVTVTNQNTGVVRTTVSNEQGLYFMPGLEPGTYTVSTELAGFAPSTRRNVALVINATLTIDFSLGLAGLEETLTVTGEAPLIEVTQSKLTATIQTTELQNLPMITRTISGMLTLLPGASTVGALHRSKQNVGTVSYGGSSGANVIPTVDGADNRDNHYGGPLMSFTTESLEEFQLATSQFNASDGRTAGAALSMVTKSGTNLLHGSAFVYERDKSLTAKDYFTRQADAEEVPFSRQQFGGSIGGPILRNRVFFFGAAEQMLEDTGIPVPDSNFEELEHLVQATRVGQLPAGLVNPNHPHFAPTPASLRLVSLKSNAQLNNAHSVMVRYAYQKDTRDAVTFNVANDLREPENLALSAWSTVGQHSWVLGNSSLNQLTLHANHMVYFSDATSNITGEHYTRDFPNVDIFPPGLEFPSVTTGARGSSGSTSDRWVLQLRDDVSLLRGNHALKFGVDYRHLPGLGLLNGNEHFATYSFFDDPSVIMTNSNGRYPQGFQTPGIVETWTQANGGAVNGQGYWADSVNTVDQFATWFQDDWRATSRLTLNLGIRYDHDWELMDQKHLANNLTRLALDAIGNPYGRVPRTPAKDFSPRLGFAYDLTGDATRVLRGGWGLYFDQYNTSASAGDITFLNRRPVNAVATLTDSAIGVGELANYRFGIDPLFPQPTEADSLPSGSTGEYIDPDIVSPRTYQYHLGYAHTLAANTVLSIDYSHVDGRDEFRQVNINPRVNGRRVLAPAFGRVLGDANALGRIDILATNNRSRYDALTFRFQRRFPRATLQAHYTLAGAYSYGGSTGNRSGAGLAQDQFDIFNDSEWGPNGPDERHRFVATGVFEMPYGIQLSPVFQAASARPYNLTAGTDLNRDGTNNDRWVDPATGEQVSLNSARGDNTLLLDLRSTKFFGLGGERRLGIFVEFFNLLNTANFGGSYEGNGRSVNFRQPTGFIPGIGYPRQVQLGARFLF